MPKQCASSAIPTASSACSSSTWPTARAVTWSGSSATCTCCSSSRMPDVLRSPSATDLAALKSIAGPGGSLEAPGDVEPFLVDFRKLYHGKSALVLLPSSTEQVSKILAYCHTHDIGLVPHGGNTSYCGGPVPDESGTQVVLGLRRLNKVRSVDPLNYSMTAEAGVVLAAVQEAAGRVDRFVPLSLAAEGSCQIGGNLSTNAGGTAVLRYGMARELVLGLEVVLPSGEIWDGLRGLRKDNTGYDLKQLFIGAEGTLGVITAAVLKLFPLPKSHATAVVALESPEKALALLERTLETCGERLTGFELFSDFCLSLVLKHFRDTATPFPRRFPYYVLME